MNTRLIAIAAEALALAAFGTALHTVQAQTPAVLSTPGLGRTDLLKRDISIPGREVVQVRVDFDHGAAAAPHSHPGEEIAFVIEGSLEYRLGSQSPVTLRAGDSLFIPAGTVHSAKNVGAGKASELATYIVDKQRPLASAAN